MLPASEQSYNHQMKHHQSFPIHRISEHCSKALERNILGSAVNHQNPQLTKAQGKGISYFRQNKQ